MLLGTTQSLEDLIVRTLATRRNATVLELRQTISSEFRPYSLPAYYKELRKLQDQGVILKRKAEYSLSLSWVLNLIRFSDGLHDQQIANPEPSDILPPLGQKTRLKFTSLQKLDDFWIHVLLVILQHSKSPHLYQWLPRPWFHLIDSHKTFPFHNALRVGGFRIDSIIGGRGFLDLHSQKLTTRGVYEFSYAESHFENERTKYYTVSDRYLLTAELTVKKAGQIDRIYETVTAWEDFDIGSAFDVLTERTDVLVTIETNPRKIKQLWNRFVEYFQVASSEKMV